MGSFLRIIDGLNCGIPSKQEEIRFWIEMAALSCANIHLIHSGEHVVDSYDYDFGVGEFLLGHGLYVSLPSSDFRQWHFADGGVADATKDNYSVIIFILMFKDQFDEDTVGNTKADTAGRQAIKICEI